MEGKYNEIYFKFNENQFSLKLSIDNIEYDLRSKILTNNGVEVKKHDSKVLKGFILHM